VGAVASIQSLCTISKPFLMSSENTSTYKSIFSRNEIIDKIAFLNWRMDSGDTRNLFNMSEGYFIAAKQLAESVLTDNRDKKGDILVFPILTCFNHAIELCLKSITHKVNLLLGNHIKVEGTHNLQQLFNTLKARVKDLKGQKGLNNFKKNLIELEEYISDLHNKVKSTPQDDKMDFSRYPFSKKYENHFYSENFKNVEVDLEKLRDLIELIQTKLTSWMDHLTYDYEE